MSLTVAPATILGGSKAGWQWMWDFRVETLRILLLAAATGVFIVVPDFAPQVPPAP